MPRPLPSEYAPYYETYVGKVPEEDALPVLRAEAAATSAFLGGLTEADSLVLHPPYTWTARQVVGHLADSERIFTDRALRFARGDATPLPGFDENAYVRNGDFDRRSLAGLAAEFAAVRAATIALFESFGDDPEVWGRSGVANGVGLGVRALGHVVAGHERHHISILRRRFGV